MKNFYYFSKVTIPNRFRKQGGAGGTTNMMEKQVKENLVYIIGKDACKNSGIQDNFL